MHSSPSISALVHATFNPISGDEQVWYSDSATTFHMTPNYGNLLFRSVYSGNASIEIGG